MKVAKAAYFDTSALLRRYVREPGTDRVLFLMKTHPVITAAIAPLEAVSALRRLEAVGDVQTKTYRAVFKRIQDDRQAWHFVAVSIEILQDAERVVQELNVRSLDAIHLASASACQKRLKRPLSFITADRQQRDAAVRLNLSVIWVE